MISMYIIEKNLLYHLVIAIIIINIITYCNVNENFNMIGEPTDLIVLR
jgi:hypothetical protein